MAGVGAKIQSYSDVVSFPATKTAGAVTISSAELAPFEKGSWSKAVIHTIWTGDSSVGDTLTIQPMVSFDGGDSWSQAGSYQDVIASSVAGDSYHVLQFAPRLRIDAVFDSVGTLSSGHGLSIDVDFHEEDPESRRHIDYSNLSLDSDALAASTTKNGDTFDLGAVCNVDVFIRVGDTAQIGDTAFTLTFEHSMDASNWVTYKTSTIGVANTQTSLIYQKEIIGNESGDTTGLWRYVRSSILSGDSVITTGSGLEVHLVGKER